MRSVRVILHANQVQYVEPQEDRTHTYIYTIHTHTHTSDHAHFKPRTSEVQFQNHIRLQ